MSRNTTSAVKPAAQINYDQKNQSERAAWNIPAWCAALGLGRSTFYILDIRPRSVKIGKRTLIIEPPGDYAERIAAMQREVRNDPRT